jgi:pimeloyl-ACP methyl ester carboxylesterase
MDDPAVTALSELVPGGVRRGELRRGDRVLRWVEAGAGQPAVILDAGLAEPGSLAWAGVLPALSARTKVIAYDRAGVGASDPVSPLTLDGEIADLAALATAVGDGPCILVGHSWGGLLAQLAAYRHPDLVAGLVLVDPADEEILATAPWRVRAVMSALGAAVRLLYPLGLLGRIIRRGFRPFAQRLTDDPELLARVLGAYAASYRKWSQVRMFPDENKLSMRSVTPIRQIRAASKLPDVPMIVLSATKGLPPSTRDRWTALQVGLTQTVASGEHLVAQDTGHAIHQERPELVTSAVIRVLEHALRGEV